MTKKTTKNNVSLTRETVKKFVRNHILRELGTVGWEGISLYVFASALTGSPVCVYGTHGAGKTMTFRLLAEKCFKQEYVLYDASKANWVDIIGYPNLEHFKEGRVEFIKTKLSIWDKRILILDELTRGREDMLNGYLEVLRNSTLQGADTGIRWKFLAANTLEYLGTRALDEALASRIGYFCEVPEFLNMSEEDQTSILHMQENSDNRGLREWNSELATPEDLIPDMSEEFTRLMKNASSKLEEVKETYSDMFAEYVRKFSTLLEARTKVKSESKGSEMVRMDGRTCGTLLTNIFACIALELVEYEELNLEFTSEALREVIAGVVQHTFPWVLTGQKVNPQALNEAHEQASYILETQDMVAYTIATERNPVKKIMLSLEMEDLEPVAIYDAVEDLLESPESVECVTFCALIGDASREHLFDKLKSNKELYERVNERFFTIARKAVELTKLPDESTPQRELLEKTYGIEFNDDPIPVITDIHLRYALLYLVVKMGSKLLESSQDYVEFESELKNTYSFVKELDEIVTKDYSKTREKLVKMKKKAK